MVIFNVQMHETLNFHKIGRWKERQGQRGEFLSSLKKNQLTQVFGRNTHLAILVLLIKKKKKSLLLLSKDL